MKASYFFKGIVSKFHFYVNRRKLTMHLKYAKMLVIVVHENMKLGDNTLNNEGLTVVKTIFLTKYISEF